MEGLYLLEPGWGLWGHQRRQDLCVLFSMAEAVARGGGWGGWWCHSQGLKPFGGGHPLYKSLLLPLRCFPRVFTGLKDKVFLGHWGRVLG